MNEVEPMSLTLELDKMHVDGAALAAPCRRYSVKELWLFRSAVRGEMRAESDVDIMIEFEPGARVGLIKFESLAPDAESTSLPDAD
jgi:predicted nucleotidyltransferase